MIKSWYDNHSLKFKITFLSTIVATLGMSIVCAAFVFFEIGTFKKELQNEQLVRLNLVGNAISAAIVFEDNDFIDEALTVFSSLPEVKNVLVFSADGMPTNEFIQYGLEEDVTASLPMKNLGALGYVYQGDNLHSQVPIYVENELVGAIVSTVEMVKLKEKILSFIMIAFAAIPAAMCLAFLMGRLFSERLVQPIEKLADTMERVKKTNNYEIVAEAPHENEMGHLAENFNEMLLEIRLRDDRLETQTQALQSQKEKAEAGSRSKSEFLANMSHELRTPMNGILGMTEVLMRSGLKQEQQKFAEIIYRSGTALTTILNDILDFSKIEADKLDLDIAPFNIQTMVTDVINLLDNKAHSKNIDLKVNFNASLKETAIGDAGRIRQVLTNIVGNAIKFTNSGSVVLDVRGKSERGKYKLSVSVRDTGIGIPAQKLDLVFQKFTQAESSTTRDYGGTGLGLAISRSLVEMMGGRIGVRSEENKGSTFWFDILLDHVETQAEPSTAQPNKKQKCEVIFLSHSAKMRKVFESKFERLGVKYTAYGDANRAVTDISSPRQASEAAPIIIIHDNAKGIDAASVLNRMKALPEGAVRPAVIIRSDNNDLKTKQVNGHAGAVTLFAPFQMRALIEKINETLANHQSRSLGAIVKTVKDAPTLTAGPTAPPLTRGARQDEAAVKAEAVPSSQNAKLRVLIADDNQVNRMVIENMIDADIYEIGIAVNGKEAVEAHQAHPFDVILMDISMPVMTGVEALHAIRALEKRHGSPKVPVIAVTAHAMASDRETYLKQGMSDYLAKPVSQAALRTVLDRWVDCEAQMAENTVQKKGTA